MATVDNLIREMTALNAQASARLKSTVAPDAPRNQAAAPTLPIGSRVLDLVTGEEGTIIDAQHTNILVYPAGQPSD